MAISSRKSSSLRARGGGTVLSSCCSSAGTLDLHPRIDTPFTDVAKRNPDDLVPNSARAIPLPVQFGACSAEFSENAWRHRAKGSGPPTCPSKIRKRTHRPRLCQGELVVATAEQIESVVVRLPRVTADACMGRRPSSPSQSQLVSSSSSSSSPPMPMPPII